jgi:hypothetical protein
MLARRKAAPQDRRLHRADCDSVQALAVVVVRRVGDGN